MSSSTEAPLAPILRERLDGDVNADLIPLLETVGYGFCRRCDPNLDALDLYDVTLVGFSMGGAEIIRYVTRHGTTRIGRLVSIEVGVGLGLTQGLVAGLVVGTAVVLAVTWHQSKRTIS